MKKAILFMMFCLVCLGGMMAQQASYYPMIKEGDTLQKWNIINLPSMYYPNGYTTYIQSISGLVTLDGVEYKLVSERNPWYQCVLGAVREENRQVFYRRNVGFNQVGYYDESYFQEEVLLYDFNLSVGDEVVVNWMQTPLVVTDESMVEVDGTMRRRLELVGDSGEEYWIEGVGSSLGFLDVGSETLTGGWNYLLCYHEGDHLVWSNDEYSSCMMTDEGWSMPFASPGSEWYFNLSSFMGSSEGCYRMAVEGDTIIQGHQCSIITRQYLGGNGDQQYVYELNRVVYWYNQTLQAFTTLYDFTADVGDSWICDVDTCAYQVTVQNVRNVTWEGHHYRVQEVTYEGNGELYYYGENQIIDGIGATGGLFPYPMACSHDVYDGSYPGYLRCYLIDGELLYHEGEYDCDEQGYCWDGTVAESYAGGDGSAENPYQIATSKQLALLAQQTNDGTGGDAYYILTDNVSLAGCSGGVVNWTSIGTLDHSFTGHFDGQSHSIYGLYQTIEVGATDPVGGLFGYTDQAAISNVSLSFCHIGGAGDKVGGLVGCASRTDISNCSINTSSSVKTTQGVAGGLVGFVDVPLGTGAGVTDPEPCYIANSHVGDAVWIEGFESAGGIVGQVNRYEGQVPCVITNCTVGNEGYPGLFTVISQKDAGGIVGWFRNGTITGCQNHYDIQAGGEKGVGGIVGQADEITLNHCTNTGNVYGEYAGGGIIGLSQSEADDGLTVINCTNLGQVVVHNTLPSGGFVGGIAGNCWNSAFIGCVNKGDVSANVEYRSTVGGIVGYSAGKLVNCYNRGTVLAVLTVPATQIEELFVGGIVGRWGTQVDNVYNTGVIDVPELPEAIPHGYGNIIGEGNIDNDYHNAYWLDDDALSACGMDDDPAAHGSSAFVQGDTPTSWMLHEAQYGTNDLLEALNSGAEQIVEAEPEYPYLCMWEEDTEQVNDGFPVLGEIVSLEGTTFFDEASGLYYTVTHGNTVEVATGPHYYQGEVVIPETVLYMGFTFRVIGLGDASFKMSSQVTSIHIPETVTYIGDDAFYNCWALDSIHIPDQVLSIGKQAFYCCTNLKYIHLPEVLEIIEDKLFYQCIELQSLVLPETVTEIHESAFEESVITHMVIPAGVRVLPNSLFFYCGQLRSVTLPAGLLSVGDFCFYACDQLTSIVIPDQVTSIGFNAFTNCHKLSRVELGRKVSFIDYEAFQTYNIGCKLTVICHNFVPAECQSNVFPEAAKQEMMIVPCGCEGIYREAWGSYWQSGNFEEDCGSEGNEWYYEILNDDGSITYQYLQHTNDTVINDKDDVHILVRINTLYDKGEHVVTTHEYIYDEDNKVYWWNNELQAFTVLYDFGAEVGDAWEILVGTESIVMHVDAVEPYEYEGRTYKLLSVSDADGLFTGIIVRGIGHLTSFFPERLMHDSKGCRVEGIRCFWQGGELVFKYGDRDCDEVYEEHHTGLEEPSEGDGFRVYPNPTDGVIVVEKVCAPSLQGQTKEYRITNTLGQTLMIGFVEGENQQINLSKLPAGLYFFTLDGCTQKIILQHQNH